MSLAFVGRACSARPVSSGPCIEGERLDSHRHVRTRRRWAPFQQYFKIPQTKSPRQKACHPGAIDREAEGSHPINRHTSHATIAFHVKTSLYSKLLTASNLGAKICITANPIGYATPAIKNGTM